MAINAEIQEEIKAMKVAETRAKAIAAEKRRKASKKGGRRKNRRTFRKKRP
jgi:hypothetical protein